VEPNSRTRNISRGLGSLTIQNVVTSVLAFLFLAALLRLTSPIEYTAYSSVLVTIGVAVIVSTFALHFAAARYLSLFLEEDEKKAWAVAKSILILSLVFSGTATVVFEFLTPYLSFYFMRNTHWTLLFELGGLWLFEYSFSTILQGIIQGMRKYSLLAKMLIISRIAMLGFAIVTLELYHDTYFAIVAWIIYYFVLIAWPLRHISKYIFQRFDSSYYRLVMKYSTPLAIAAIFGIISTSGDSIVIGGYTNSLGPYSAAVQISATLGVVIVTPLMTTFLPEVSSSSKDNTKVAQGVRLAVRFLTLGLLPASLLMASLSVQLLFLFSGGGSYLSAVQALQLMAGTYLFYGAQLMITSLLQAIDRTVQVLIVVAVAAVTDFGLAVLLVPSLGMIGGATSRALEALIGLIIAVYFVRRYFVNLDSKIFYLKGLLASLLPFAIVLALSSFVSDRTLTLIPYSIIGVLAFLACIKTMKILSNEDRIFICHLLPSQLHKFLDYI
jgi:O-antigen/teichoic acid export membrane protein